MIIEVRILKADFDQYLKTGEYLVGQRLNYETGKCEYYKKVYL